MRDVIIERVSNGYVIRHEPRGETVVVEEKENDEKGHKAFCELVNCLMEIFDLYGSKHDERRLVIASVTQDTFCKIMEE